MAIKAVTVKPGDRILRRIRANSLPNAIVTVERVGVNFYEGTIESRSGEVNKIREQGNSAYYAVAAKPDEVQSALERFARYREEARKMQDEMKRIEADPYEQLVSYVTNTGNGTPNEWRRLTLEQLQTIKGWLEGQK